MGKFNRDGDRGGFSSGHKGHGGGFAGRGGTPRFGGPKFGGSRFGDRGPVVMNDAICDDCKKPCQVPFRPSSGKPVYCKDCFAKRGGGPAKSFGDTPRHDFKSEGRLPSASEFSNNDIKTQLAMLNIKLDKVVKALVLDQKPAATPVVKSEVKAVPEKSLEKVKKTAKVVKSKKVSKK